MKTVTKELIVQLEARYGEDMCDMAHWQSHPNTVYGFVAGRGGYANYMANLFAEITRYGLNTEAFSLSLFTKDDGSTDTETYYRLIVEMCNTLPEYNQRFWNAYQAVFGLDLCDYEVKSENLR